jgi:hypothetical protein
MTELESQLVLNGIQNLQEGQNRIIDLQAQTVERLDHLDDCVDGCKDQISQLEAKLLSAFPDGDPVGHRSYHEKVIVSRTNWQRIKNSVLGKAIEYMAIAVGGWAIITLWGGFKIVVSS